MAVSASCAPLVGTATPRLASAPRRELTPATSAGFEACDFAEDILGIALMPWQRWLLVHALELDEAGTFRWRTVLVQVARQSGKTTVLLVLALWRMYLDRAQLVIGTAQNLDVAEETWSAAVDMAESVPALAREIEHVDRTNGKKALRLATKERYKVAAASRRGGRGLSGDLVLLDELREHQTWEAWSAVTKTTLARGRPQVWCASNAGDSRSVVLNTLRGKALTAVADPASTLGIFEWSAPDDCELDDRAAWAQANPALGYTVTEAAVASALDTDPEPVFRTEVLCQRVPDLVPPSALHYDSWLQLADPGSQIASHIAFGLDVRPDRSRAAVGVAGLTGDGRLHVEVVEHSRGTSWCVPRLVALRERWGADATVVLDARGPAGSLVPQLSEAGIEPLVVSAGDLGKACGAAFDAVTAGRWVHLGQPELDAAVAGAGKRPVGDAWAFDRRADADICPLVAVTLAAWAVAGSTRQEVLLW